MSNTIHYFAYGSNMHPARFEARIGRCPNGVVAFLHGARLTFAKRGLDGSGKCDVQLTGLPSDNVAGVLYRVTASQKRLLDNWEATTCGYTAIAASVECCGQTVDVFTYKARQEHIDTGLLPYDWYKRLVVLGASHFGLPHNYIQTLEKHRSVPDSDRLRATQNGILISVLEQANQRLAPRDECGEI